MELNWNDLISRLPGMLKKLENTGSVQVGGDLSPLPSNGVYMLSENGKPIFIGKSSYIQKHTKFLYARSETVYALSWALLREDVLKNGVNIKGKIWQEFESDTSIRYSHDPYFKYNYREGRRKPGISESWLNTRDMYDQNEQYQKWYKLVKTAKQRVKQMEVRAIEIQDPTEKDMLLMYICMKLKVPFRDDNLYRI